MGVQPSKCPPFIISSQVLQYTVLQGVPNPTGSHPEVDMFRGPTNPLRNKPIWESTPESPNQKLTSIPPGYISQVWCIIQKTRCDPRCVENCGSFVSLPPFLYLYKIQSCTDPNPDYEKILEDAVSLPIVHLAMPSGSQSRMRTTTYVTGDTGTTRLAFSGQNLSCA